MRGRTASLIVLFALSGCDMAPDRPETITTGAADGTTVYGEPYFGGLPRSAPLVLLFHQGGSNGRGEYADIAAWLNANGFRTIAWDQRSGGEIHGGTNRTAAAFESRQDYCEAYPDLQAALDYVISQGLAEKAIVWGSSYSGALVFRLGAENPATVSAVIAFSPAAGGPMKACLAQQWSGSLVMPAAAFSPESEMERDSTTSQYERLSADGVEYRVVANGVHGSSMLLDERTGHDMSAVREQVIHWLQTRTGAETGHD